MRPFCSAACAQEAPLTGATRPPPPRASRLLQEPAGAGWPWGSRPHVLPPPPSQTKPAPSGPVALAPRFTLRGPFDFFPLLSSSLPRPPSPAASWTAFSFVPPSLPSRLKHTAPVDLAPPPLPSPSGAQHIYDKGDCPFLLVFFNTALIFSCCLLRCLSEPTFYPQPLKTSRNPLGTSAAFLVSFSRFVFCFSLSLREQ